MFGAFLSYSPKEFHEVWCLDTGINYLYNHYYYYYYVIIDSSPEIAMGIVMLMPFKYLIYVLYMTEDFNLMKFLSLMFY
jgi:hypothetical protein